MSDQQYPIPPLSITYHLRHILEVRTAPRAGTMSFKGPLSSRKLISI